MNHLINQKPLLSIKLKKKKIKLLTNKDFIEQPETNYFVNN